MLRIVGDSRKWRPVSEFEKRSRMPDTSLGAQVWWMASLVRLPRMYRLWAYFDAMAMRLEINIKQLQVVPRQPSLASL